MQKKIEQYMEQYHMVSADDTVIVGVSGGADSMCLLCVLENYQKKIGFQLSVVHVNHMLRQEAADADEAFVEAYCRENQIPYECFRVPVDTLAKEQKLSAEEAGRIARRQAFAEAMRKYNGTKIALAHHMNDNAETFLHNLARGSGLDGLSGMKPVNEEYIRPLLCVNRGEIEEYLKERNLSYCVDATNEQDMYTRNRIRNHIVPYFQAEVNARTVEHIQSAVGELEEIRQYLEVQTEKLIQNYLKTNDGILILDELKNELPLMQRRVLKKALVEIAGSEKDIESKHVEMLRNLLEKQVGRQMDFPYGVKANRVYEGIQLQKTFSQEEIPEKIEISHLKMGEINTFRFGKWTVEMKLFERPVQELEVPKKTFTKWFDYDIIKKNVCIRCREAGDRLVIDDFGKTQKLKNYFINEKIPSDKRSHIPLIADGEQIMWVVGHRQSQAYQITEQTENILQISAYKM